MAIKQEGAPGIGSPEAYNKYYKDKGLTSPIKPTKKKDTGDQLRIIDTKTGEVIQEGRRTPNYSPTRGGTSTGFDKQKTLGNTLIQEKTIQKTTDNKTTDPIKPKTLPTPPINQAFENLTLLQRITTKKQENQLQKDLDQQLTNFAQNQTTFQEQVKQFQEQYTTKPLSQQQYDIATTKKDDLLDQEKELEKQARALNFFTSTRTKQLAEQGNKKLEETITRLQANQTIQNIMQNQQKNILTGQPTDTKTNLNITRISPVSNLIPKTSTPEPNQPAKITMFTPQETIQMNETKTGLEKQEQLLTQKLGTEQNLSQQDLKVLEPSIKKARRVIAQQASALFDVVLLTAPYGKIISSIPILTKAAAGVGKGINIITKSRTARFIAKQPIIQKTNLLAKKGVDKLIGSKTTVYADVPFQSGLIKIGKKKSEKLLVSGTAPIKLTEVKIGTGLLNKGNVSRKVLVKTPGSYDVTFKKLTSIDPTNTRVDVQNLLLKNQATSKLTSGVQVTKFGSKKAFDITKQLQQITIFEAQGTIVIGGQVTPVSFLLGSQGKNVSVKLLTKKIQKGLITTTKSRINLGTSVVKKNILTKQGLITPDEITKETTTGIFGSFPTKTRVTSKLRQAQGKITGTITQKTRIGEIISKKGKDIRFTGALTNKINVSIIPKKIVDKPIKKTFFKIFKQSKTGNPVIPTPKTQSLFKPSVSKKPVNLIQTSNKGGTKMLLSSKGTDAGAKKASTIISSTRADAQRILGVEQKMLDIIRTKYSNLYGVTSNLKREIGTNALRVFAAPTTRASYSGTVLQNDFLTDSKTSVLTNTKITNVLKQDSVLKTNTLTGQKTSLVLDSAQKTSTLLDSAQKTSTLTGQKTMQKTSTPTKTLTKTSTLTLTQPLVKPLNLLTPKTITNKIIPRIPFPPFPPQNNGKNNKKNTTQLYHAQVKKTTGKKKKFVKVTKKPLPKNTAWNQGLKVADNTIAQTVRLKKSRVVKRFIPDAPRINDQKFYDKKKTKIEKRSNAIDTIGEQNNLTVAKYLSQQSKKQNLFFSKQKNNTKKIKLI